MANDKREHIQIMSSDRLVEFVKRDEAIRARRLRQRQLKQDLLRNGIPDKEKELGKALVRQYTEYFAAIEESKKSMKK